MIKNKLPYNTKRIQKPGKKYKTTLCEISPGVWVPRHATPEGVEYRKKYNANPVNKARKRLTWVKYLKENKTKINAKQRAYRAENREHKKKINDAWNSTEYGFIMNLYSGARKDAIKGRYGKDPVPFEFDKKSWWEHWLKQKVIYGMKCPYSVLMGEPVEMTHVRGKGVRTHTNISRDQIWPGLGYTKFNLVFCASKFNDSKNSITPAGCQAVIELYQQRYNEYLINKKTGGDNIYGSDFHLKAVNEHYLNGLPKKYKTKIMEMAYLQSKLEKAKKNNDLIRTKEVEFEIKNFYEKK